MKNKKSKSEEIKNAHIFRFSIFSENVCFYFKFNSFFANNYKFLYE